MGSSITDFAANALMRASSALGGDGTWANLSRRLNQLEGSVEKATAFEDTFAEGKFKGRATSWDAWFPQTSPTPPGELSYATLRRIYSESPTVRSCVDTIARVVSTAKYAIDGDPGHNPEDLQRARDLFYNPNPNAESFQSLLIKTLTDALVLDAGVIEKVKGPTRKLLALMARDGATFLPSINTNGLITGYKQVVWRGGIKYVDFTPDEIVYIKLFPSTNTTYGHPIIESVVDEVGTLLFCIQFIAESFTNNEIPPGILHLGTIGDIAYNRARDSFRLNRGQRAEQKIRVIDNVDIVEWIQLNRPNREMQLAELMNRIQRIVFQAFGVMPAAMGETQDVNKAVAETQERIEQSHLIEPLMNLLTYIFNTELLPDIGPHLKFRFLERRTGEPQKLAQADKSRLESGLRNHDELRDADGLPPIEGGDVYRVLQNKEWVRVDSLDETPSIHRPEGTIKPGGNNGDSGKDEGSAEEED